MRKSIRSAASFILSAAFAFSSFSSVSAFEIRSEVPSNDPDAPEYRYYFSSENPYNTFGDCEMPNCTAYAWGRVFEVSGTAPKLSRNNAGKWYRENINMKAYSYGSEPKPGAVLCYDRFDENTGHVEFVESVSEDRSLVTVTESQYKGKMFATYEQASDESKNIRGYRLLGYIYPDDTEAKFYGDAFRLVNTEGSTMLTVSDDASVSLSEKLIGTVSQNYRFEPLENGNYRIWSSAYDLVLTNTEDGVFFLENDFSADSEWSVITEINDLYTICRPDDTNKVLTFSEGNAYVSDYTASMTQFWDISRVTGITPLTTSERNIVFSLDCTQTRTEYYTDEFLDLSGIRFFLNGNMIENADISKLTADYDFTEPGISTVTVSYGYSGISFDVTVTEPEEGQEVVRNNELHNNIKNYIINSDNNLSDEELDVNNDGVINAVDVLLTL